MKSGVIDFIDVGSLSDPIAYGQISAEGGRAGYQYLDRAIDATLSGTVVGLSTATTEQRIITGCKATLY